MPLPINLWSKAWEDMLHQEKKRQAQNSTNIDKNSLEELLSGSVFECGICWSYNNILKYI